MGSKLVTGNLATDPSLMGSGENTWTKIRLAEQQRELVRGAWQDGEKVFYDVAIRDKQLGEHILKSVIRGDRITAIGNYTIEPYLDANGNNGINHRLYAYEVAASLKFNDVKLERTPNPNYGPQQTAGARMEADYQAIKAQPASETVNVALDAANNRYGFNQQQPPAAASQSQTEGDRLSELESKYLADRNKPASTPQPRERSAWDSNSTQPPRSPNPGHPGPPVAPAPRTAPGPRRF